MKEIHTSRAREEVLAVKRRSSSIRVHSVGIITPQIRLLTLRKRVHMSWNLFFQRDSFTELMLSRIKGIVFFISTWVRGFNILSNRPTSRGGSLASTTNGFRRPSHYNLFWQNKLPYYMITRSLKQSYWEWEVPASFTTIGLAQLINVIFVGSTSKASLYSILCRALKSVSYKISFFLEPFASIHWVFTGWLIKPLEEGLSHLGTERGFIITRQSLEISIIGRIHLFHQLLFWLLP